MSCHIALNFKQELFYVGLHRTGPSSQDLGENFMKLNEVIQARIAQVGAYRMV